MKCKHAFNLCILPLLFLTLAACLPLNAESGLLLNLDASALNEGPLASWKNSGSLEGSFAHDGTTPQVAVIDGVKAVVFDGDDHILADITAPDSITGDKPWTCIVRTRCIDVSGERTLVSWANRPGNCMEIEYGDAALWGALGTWSEHTTGWGDDVPLTNQWHTLVYSYAGGAEGEFQAWCDGEQRVSKNMTLNTKPGRPFVLGACMGGDPGTNATYTHFINGAIASVKLYNRAFSPREIWNASGKQSACLLSPPRDAGLETLSTTLTWVPGSDGVAVFDVYLDTDRTAVEKAGNSMKPGTTVYKGKQPAAKKAYGPVKLALGTTYYWRIDQRDTTGKVTRGQVWSFSTENGNAHDPAPSDDYIFVEGGKYSLAWKPGKYAEKQNIYFGSSAQEVLSKKKPDLAGLPATQATLTWPVKKPVPGKNYYWRVESVNRNNLPASTGSVWSFRVVKKKVKVYLLAGQSNAVGCSSVKGLPAEIMGIKRNVVIFVRGECRLGEYGWAYLTDGLGASFGDRDGKGTFGPELTFGINMAPDNDEEVIAIIKCAWGGTNLGDQWRPPSAGGQVGPLYEGFVKAYDEAMAALDPAFEPELAGMIWMQGESDSGNQKMSDEYAKNLTCLIKDIRAETKCPDLPFVIAQITKAPAWDNPPARGDLIRAAERDVARSVPNTATFATDDYGMCDPWHYDTPGMKSLGERFAAAMKILEKKNK